MSRRQLEAAGLCFTPAVTPSPASTSTPPSAVSSSRGTPPPLPPPPRPVTLPYPESRQAAGPSRTTGKVRKRLHSSPEAVPPCTRKRSAPASPSTSFSSSVQGIEWAREHVPKQRSESLNDITTFGSRSWSSIYWGSVSAGHSRRGSWRASPNAPTAYDSDAAGSSSGPDDGPRHLSEGLVFRPRKGGRRDTTITEPPMRRAGLRLSERGHETDRELDVITSDPDAPPTQHLPTARRTEPSRAILTNSQRWALLLFFLQLLSIVPAFFGTLYCAKQVWGGPNALRHSDGIGGIMEPRSTRLDYLAAGVWAFASGYWCWSIASGLLRRWLVYYEFVPAMVRLVSLQAIIWPLTRFMLAIVGWDQPLLGWVICGASSAVSNTVQLYVTSNIRISASDKPASWSQGVPQLRASAKKYRALNLRQAIVRNGMPLAMLAWATLPLLYWEVYELRWPRAANVSPWSTEPARAAAPPATATTAEGAEVKVLVLVTSSWTDRSLVNRGIFRNSSLRLLPPSSSMISFDHRFVIGDAPSPFVQARQGPSILDEMATFHDILPVSAPDGYNDLSRKTHAALTWADAHDFDYLLKTDDDMFIRFDTLASEISQLGKRELYWKGLAYHNIPPIHDASNKNAAFDYDLPLFPPFTAGALYILSRDLVGLISASGASRRFTQNEDQNLGIWLYPFGVRPIHDVRIQQAHVCEDDMLAKHFSPQYREPSGLTAVDMYRNVISGRPMCQGFMQKWCGVCYPHCRGRANHWTDWGFACDEFKGVTLAARPEGAAHALADAPLRAAPEPAAVGGPDDPWIVPGLLSRRTSTYSLTDDWHLLFMMCWTTAADTFQERHYQTIETVWAHEPRAVVFVLSTTLPADFFSMYTEYGYAIHVIRVGRSELLDMGWYAGPESRRWLKRWDAWRSGPYFFSHLTDYLRFVWLFKYGGTYMDMDAPWIRAPPDPQAEFIGADVSTVAGDAEWALDDGGTYLAPGVMRFRRGWEMFRDLGESAFTVGRYKPECFNCVGPRAITRYVKPRRRRLEAGGLRILERQVLYPKNWVQAEELVLARQPEEARAELGRIAEKSWSIHLFGKMTNHIPIHPSSIIAVAFSQFTLSIPRRAARLSSSPSSGLSPTSDQAPGLSLVHPQRYTFRSRLSLAAFGDPTAWSAGGVDGAMDGLHKVFIRGARRGVAARAAVELSAERGEVAWGPATPRLRGLQGEADAGREAAAGRVRWSMRQATVQAVNAVLSGWYYRPGAGAGCADGGGPARGQDRIAIAVRFGEESVEGSIAVEC